MTDPQMTGPYRLGAPWWYEDDQPLVAFDTETTGADPSEARIVSAHVGGVDLLVNPGIEIPAEATAVHGITTEDVVANGLEEVEGALRIYDLIVEHADAGTPIVAFNAAYDFTVTDRLLRRHGLRLPHGILVVDPYVLDKATDPYRKGKRTLADVARLYDVALEGAHEAAADANAAVAVARAMGRAHSPSLDWAPYVLQQKQAGWRWQQQAGLQEYFRRKDPTVVVDGHWPVQPLGAAVGS